MIDADYNELRDDELGASDDLDLTEDDALPWLENDDEEEDRGGVDIAQLIGFMAVLAAVGLGVLALIWFLGNKTGDAAIIADGSTIEAPVGPYKVRPDDPDAKEFPGTGDVAPAVGDGQSPDPQLASNTGAGSGDQNLDIPMPSLPGETPRDTPRETGGASGESGSATGTNGASGANQSASSSSASGAASDAASAAGTASSGAASEATGSGGIGVQLAAYGTRARAEQGWKQISSKTKALNGYTPDIRKGTAGIGTVYRLKVLTGTRDKATTLCRTLRAQGIDCAVKP